MGDRNSNHDGFNLVEIGNLAEGGPFFDALAISPSDEKLSRALRLISEPNVGRDHRNGRRAIVYVAWGKTHIDEAIISARTAASVGVDRLLITDHASREFLLPGAPFEQVIEHVFSLPGQLAKTEMFDLLPSEYDSFLFLDADTYVLLDIAQGFEKAEVYGIAAAQAAGYSFEDFWGFSKILDQISFRSKGILLYNSGVIFFTRSPEAWKVLKKWHELCRDADGDVSAWGDQPYLTLAMETLGFNPYTLSTAYNYRNLGDLASGAIRIWHSHMPPPADVNQFEHSWPPRRFRQGQRLEDSG
jgi:hypothetical protein